MAFMQWFKIYADLQHHPKRWRFEELANTEYGLHYLTAWFSYVCKFASNGDISGFTPKQVARACEWNGDPQVFWDALVGAGFIDQTEAGLVAHDWYEENGRFIRENERKKEPTGNPRVTRAKPKGNPCDKTVQDSTPTPAANAAHKDFTDYFWAKHQAAHGQKPNPPKWVFKNLPKVLNALGIPEAKRRADNYFADPYLKAHPLEDFIGSPDKWIECRTKVGGTAVTDNRVQMDRKRTAL